MLAGTCRATEHPRGIDAKVTTGTGTFASERPRETLAMLHATDGNKGETWGKHGTTTVSLHATKRVRSPDDSPRMTEAESTQRSGGTRTGNLVNRLRNDVAAGKVAPGERLTEEALAETYGVSRTPVREALRVLTQEMLLDHVPHWGHQVARLRLSDLDDLYAVRLGIERQSVQRLAEGTGDLAAAERLLEAWDLPPGGHPTDVNLVFADEEFHETMAAAAGGTVLLPTLRQINRRLHSVRIREFIDEVRVRRTYEQHTSILHAILHGDATLATARMYSHILEGHRFVRASAMSSGMVAGIGEGLDDAGAGVKAMLPR